MPGSLFVVATPIGNLEDLTFRALRTLKEVDLIAAEDTRRTSRLLAHYGVAKPLVSLHEHNEHREAPRLVDRIQRGESIALVSDAGTPAISDPGTTLVRLCRVAGVAVVAVPGPSAITAALSVTGVPATPFTFMGFPPASGRAREQWFEVASEAPGVVLFFEAPHRIRRTLHEATRLFDRPIFVHREISKFHEELVTWHKYREAGTPEVSERGEFVVVVGPPAATTGTQPGAESMLAVLDAILAVPSMTEAQALAGAAAVFGLSAQKTRTLVKKARILVKRQNDSTP